MDNKKMITKKIIARIAFCLLIGSSLSACGTLDRLSRVGKAPPMTPIENPRHESDYHPISMPMPAPQLTTRQPNSLWQSGHKSFFKDQRASNVGDILTVIININDQAEVKNKTTRERDGTESAAAPHVFGFEGKLGKILPSGVDPSNLGDITSTSSTTGDGQIKRDEQITLKLAAVITQVLPNGNMVINGSQEVLVNYEKRVLSIRGIIRPEDISAVDNSIPYDKIAEARIIYGGEGEVSDIQQPRYGQQIFDILSPF